MTTNVQHELRKLPSVDELLRSERGSELVNSYGRQLSTEAIRQGIDEERNRILQENGRATDNELILETAARSLAELVRPTLRSLINATGVIVHTNLGRAPLSARALEAVLDVARGYSNLEYDLDTGSRGSRAVHAEDLLRRLIGAEGALVVNNNAAAVLLMLTALCRGKEVLISRSQLIEIGGGFRVPDVMAQSGAKLVEVGTTNRTHLRDYQQAINESTAAILVAHHSNFKIVGFTTEPSLKELAHLCARRGIHLLLDEGSGTLIDTSKYGLEAEATAGEAIEAGVHVVAFSGDKLLGGPQAGILCGRERLISTINRHPLARAVRADKMVLAALTTTLTSYLTGRHGVEIPVIGMIALSVETLDERAEGWARVLSGQGVNCEVIQGESTVGGGSLPGTTLPTRLLAIDVPHAERFAGALRQWDPPVIGRLAEGRLLLDPRTVSPEEDQLLLEAVTSCIRPGNHSDE